MRGGAVLMAALLVAVSHGALALPPWHSARRTTTRIAGGHAAGCGCWFAPRRCGGASSLHIEVHVETRSGCPRRSRQPRPPLHRRNRKSHQTASALQRPVATCTDEKQERQKEEPQPRPSSNFLIAADTDRGALGGATCRLRAVTWCWRAPLCGALFPAPRCSSRDDESGWQSR